MADCFSLMNMAELVEMLRVEAEAVQAIEWEIPICTSKHLAQAADVLEQAVKQNAGMVKRCDELLAENAKLKAELDAAVRDMLYVKECAICKYIRTATCEGCHVDKDRWEWRGVQNESD